MGAVAAIKAAGYGEAYEALLPREMHDTIVNTVAGMWLPVDVARAHYRACDGLNLSADAAAQLGRGTFARTKGLLLGAAVGLAKGVGVTPWTMVPHFQRFWLRGYDGGGVKVTKTGPKEFLMLITNFSLFESKYYRAALRGLTGSLLELVCQKAYVVERPVSAPESSILFRAQWV